MKDIILKWGAFELSLFNSSIFKVENIENLTWGSSELATTVNPYLPGDNIQNSRPMPRDITITLVPLEDKGDYSDLIHQIARLYNKEVTLVWKNRVIPPLISGYTSLTTDLQISGTLNEFETPRFGKESVKLVFNIHCSNPFWSAIQETEVSLSHTSLISAYFCNYSEIDAGFKLEFTSVQLSEESPYIRVDIEGTPIAFQFYITSATPGVYPSDGYLCLTFEKGNVSLVAGSSKETAANAANRYKWSVYKGVRISLEEQRYSYTPFNGIPLIPTSTQRCYLLIIGNRIGASLSRPYSTAKLTFTPKFI